MPRVVGEVAAGQIGDLGMGEREHRIDIELVMLWAKRGKIALGEREKAGGRG